MSRDFALDAPHIIIAVRRLLFASLAFWACGTTASGPDDASPPIDASAPVDGSVPVEAGLDTGQDAADASDVGVEAGADAGYGPYDVPGLHSVSTQTLSMTTANGTFTITAYVPSGAGSFPVLVLSAGLLQPAAAYAEYGQRAASWGMVAFLRDDPGLLQSSSTIADDVAYEATTWVQAQNAAGPLAGKLDTTKVGLAGHSRGGQVSLLAAEGTAKGKIAGVFGFDPVDGSPAALTSIASIGVPLAFLGETTDSTGSMPCAPAAQNFEALYTAAASPAVAVTIVGADHTMFEDPTYCQFCSFCTAGTANGANVRALSARYMTAFFAREMLGDASVGAAFEGAGSGLDVAGGVVTLQSK